MSKPRLASGSTLDRKSIALQSPCPFLLLFGSAAAFAVPEGKLALDRNQSVTLPTGDPLGQT